MAVGMMLEDGGGGAHRVHVSDDGALHTIPHTHPVELAGIFELPVSEFFTDDGTSSGSSDMRVNGSTTAVDFSVAADPSDDIYITVCAVVLADAGAALNEFGNLSALTNGVQFLWKTQDLGDITIHRGVTTNFEFVQLGLGSPAFGDAANSFRAPNVTGVAEAYLPVIDFRRLFGMTHGFKLRAGTNDSLVFRVRDDLSVGIDRFDVQAYGKKIRKT